MTNGHRLPILGPEAPSEFTEDKLLKVGELARACGKTVRAIHHYEKVGLLRPHKRSKGRYRLYSPDAVARVRWIGKLHDLGMTLSEIKRIVSSWEKAPSAPDAMAEIRSVFEDRLQEVKEQIARLSSLERELQASLRYLDSCDACHPTELIATCTSCDAKQGQPEPELVAGLYAAGGRQADEGMS